MARRCGCASDSCSCVVVAGDGMTVAGAGSERNPYVITSNVLDIETGIDVQVNNTVVATDVHQLDFRGSGVTVASGADEAVVTVPGISEGGAISLVPSGVIWMYGSTEPPAGWLLCAGQTLAVDEYQDLFAAIGTKFGGDGVANFMLPNLMDRFPVGASATKPIDGTPGGSATKTIAVTNLPPHAHTLNHNHGAFNTGTSGNHVHDLELSNQDGTAGSIKRGTSNIQVGTGPVRSSGAHVHSINVPNFTGNTGTTVGATGAPIDILPPWLALGFIIKI